MTGIGRHRGSFVSSSFLEPVFHERALPGEVHVAEIVAIAAFQRIVRLQSDPFALGQLSDEEWKEMREMTKTK